MRRITTRNLNTLCDKSNADMTIPERDVPNYYAVVLGSDIGFIMSTGYREGRYEVLSSNYFTVDNSYGYHSNTLRGLVSKLLRHDIIVLEFKTPLEFFSWMAKASESIKKHSYLIKTLLKNEKKYAKQPEVSDRKISMTL